MKPRRTHTSTKVFRLAGGNEDNDLWVEIMEDDRHNPVIASTWEPTAEERQEIADGANVLLMVWGQGTPPVAVSTTKVPLGKPPEDEWPYPDEDPPDPL